MVLKQKQTILRQSRCCFCEINDKKRLTKVSGQAVSKLDILDEIEEIIGSELEPEEGNILQICKACRLKLLNHKEFIAKAKYYFQELCCLGCTDGDAAGDGRKLEPPPMSIEALLLQFKEKHLAKLSVEDTRKLDDSFRKMTLHLLDNQLYSDVTMLMEDGRKISGHKIILSTRSEDWGILRFEEIDTIDLSDIRYDIAYGIIKWAYTDNIDYSDYDDAAFIQLFTAATKFQLTALGISCQTKMMGCVTFQNYMKYYHIAEEICADVLKNFCLDIWNKMKAESVPKSEIVDSNGAKRVPNVDSEKSEEMASSTKITNESEDVNCEDDQDDDDTMEDATEDATEEEDTIEDKTSADDTTDVDKGQLDDSTISDHDYSQQTDESKKKDIKNEVNEPRVPFRFVQRYMSICSGELPFKCEVCDNKYAKKRELQSHMVVHLGKNPFKCVICEQGFHSKKELRQHTSSHPEITTESIKEALKVTLKQVKKEKPSIGVKSEDAAKCTPAEDPETKARFFEEKKKAERANIDPKNPFDILQKYMSIIPGMLPFKCEVCDEKYAKKRELQSHLAVHFGEKPFKCTMCKEAYKTKIQLDTHTSVHTGITRFQCKVCGKSLKEGAALRIHMDAFHNKNRRMHQCEICGKSYTSIHNLKKHQKYHLPNEERPFQCKVCNRGFTCGTYFREHLRIHTGEKPYKCQYCDRTFSSIGTFHKHVKNIHNRSLCCGVCGKTFVRKYLLKSHMIEHSADLASRYKCDFCSRCFLGKSGLDYHISLKHTQLLDPEEYIVPNENSFSCKLCGEIFCDWGTVKSHILAHPGFQPQTCDVCHELFDNRALLAEHEVKEHSGGKPFQCDVCSQSFGKRYILDHHRKRHTEHKIAYCCVLCGEGFLYSRLFQSHIRRHRVRKDHLKEEFILQSTKSKEELCAYLESHMKRASEICDICGKSFTKRKYLQVHMATHSEDRTHYCEVCGKTYKSKSDLNNHKVTHSGEKNHKCSVCRYATYTASLLQRHMLSHSTERPHQCDICGKSFKRKKTLADHLKTHYGIKPFKCEVCYKNFTLKSALTAHKRTHTGEKPYKCSICFKEFGDSRSRKRHEASNHGINHEKYFVPSAPLNQPPPIQQQPLQPPMQQQPMQQSILQPPPLPPPQHVSQVTLPLPSCSNIPSSLPTNIPSMNAPPGFYIPMLDPNGMFQRQQNMEMQTAEANMSASYLQYHHHH